VFAGLIAADPAVFGYSQQLLNGDRQRSDAPAGGVVYGVGDGGW
jgi:hypothetical protein